MAAQYLNAWSPAATIAANTALLSIIEVGTGDATITIHSIDDELLATVLLQDPAGEVNGTSGTLTLLEDTASPVVVVAGISNETASYASIRDRNGDVVRSIQCISGTASVANRFVLRNTLLSEGDTISIQSMYVA